MNNSDNAVVRIGYEAGLEGHHETFVKYLKRLDLELFVKLKRPRLIAVQKRKRLS